MNTVIQLQADSPKIPYGMVKREVLCNPNLSFSARTLYSYFCTFWGDKDYCYPAIRTIAEDLGCSVNTVQKAANELDNFNIVNIKRNKDTSNYYFKAVSKTDTVKPCDVSEIDTLTVSKSDTGVSKSDTVNLNIKEKGVSNNDTNNYHIEDKEIYTVRRKKKIADGNKKKDKEFAEEVIKVFNEITDRKISLTKDRLSTITARKKEGYGIPQFRAIIEFKNRQWKNDPGMCHCIRPETLFIPKHIQDYLEQARNDYRQQQNKNHSGAPGLKSLTSRQVKDLFESP